MYRSRQGAVHTGHRCNQNCNFCFQRFLDKESIRGLHELKADFDYCRQHGDDNIYLCGGEPTVYPHLFEILDYMNGKGAALGLVTNGAKLADEDFCKKLADHGVSIAHLSYHSCVPFLHDAMTGVRGSHYKLMRAIYNMQKYDIWFRAYMCITSTNYPTIEGSVRELKDLGAKMVSLSLWDASCWTMLGERPDILEAMQDVPASQDVIAPHLKSAMDFCWSVKLPFVVRMANFCRFKGYEKYLRNWMQTPWSASECNPNTNYWVAYRGQCAIDADAELMMRKYHVEPYFTLLDECKECAMQYVCGGVQRGLEELDGVGLDPYPGKIVYDPLYFAGDTSWEADWYKEKLNGSNAKHP